MSPFATERRHRPIFIGLVLATSLLFPVASAAQASEVAGPYIVFESGKMVSGDLRFSRSSLERNLLSLNEIDYRLSDILFFWDGRDYFGRTPSNLVLRRVEAGRVDLFADFKWTNAAGIEEPSGKRVPIGPRFVRKGYYSSLRAPLRRVTESNLRKDLQSNEASMALLDQHKRLSSIELGLVVGGTVATGAALIVSKPSRSIPPSVVPGILIVASALVPHYLKRHKLLDAIREFNR